jgi:hypothetical protein
MNGLWLSRMEGPLSSQRAGGCEFIGGVTAERAFLEALSQRGNLLILDPARP